MSRVKDWYYEEYDDQSGGEFDYVGVSGKEPVPIADLIGQVAEFKRLYGNDITVYVYRSSSELCGVAT